MYFEYLYQMAQMLELVLLVVVYMVVKLEVQCSERYLNENTFEV